MKKTTLLILLIASSAAIFMPATAMQKSSLQETDKLIKSIKGRAKLYSDVLSGRRKGDRKKIGKALAKDIAKVVAALTIIYGIKKFTFGPNMGDDGSSGSDHETIKDDNFNVADHFTKRIFDQTGVIQFEFLNTEEAKNAELYRKILANWDEFFISGQEIKFFWETNSDNQIGRDIALLFAIKKISNDQYQLTNRTIEPQRKYLPIGIKDAKLDQIFNFQELLKALN